MEHKPENQNPFRALAQDLLREPFAVDHSFAKESMEGVAKLLEADNEVTQSSVPSSHIESYERCKAIFCMLLLELENAPSAIVNLTLEQIAGHEASVPAMPTAPSPAPGLTLSPAPKEVEIKPTVASPKPVAPGPGLTHPLAAEYFVLAGEIAGWKKPESQISIRTVRRLEIQQLCFALELETQAKLAMGLGGFARNRIEALHRILISQDRKFDFSPEVKKLFERIEKDFSGLLFAGKFPTLSMMNALKYLQSLMTLEGYRPSMMESGALLFFFALPKPVEGLPISNLLQANGIVPAKILELALRLCRTQKLRGLAFDPASALDEKHESQLREDIAACFSLLKGLHTGAEMPLKKVG